MTDKAVKMYLPPTSDIVEDNGVNIDLSRLQDNFDHSLEVEPSHKVLTDVHLVPSVKPP